jgi:glycine/D-amino acid oxidase-like deaminating enzyme
MNEACDSSKHYDQIVIGSGAAGHHVANQAATPGKKVLVIEQSSALGGACNNTGTIHSKTLREAVIGLTTLRARRTAGHDLRSRSSVPVAELELVPVCERSWAAMIAGSTIHRAACTSIFIIQKSFQRAVSTRLV